MKYHCLYHMIFILIAFILEGFSLLLPVEKVMCTCKVNFCDMVQSTVNVSYCFVVISEGFFMILQVSSFESSKSLLLGKVIS